MSGLLTTACSDDIPAVESEPPELTFIGSEQCQGCHQSQYQDWQGSHHQLAMQIASAETVLGDAHQQFANDFDIAWALATIHRDRGEQEQALALAEELEEAFPDEPGPKALIESLSTAAVD